MKSFLLLCLSFFLISYAVGQDIFASDQRPIPHFLTKRGYVFPDSVKGNNTVINYQWPDSLYYNTVYKSKLMGSLTVPISFSNIELNHGNYVLSPTISLGIGYTWFLVTLYLMKMIKITVGPYILLWVNNRRRAGKQF